MSKYLAFSIALFSLTFGIILSYSQLGILVFPFQTNSRTGELFVLPRSQLEEADEGLEFLLYIIIYIHMYACVVMCETVVFYGLEFILYRYMYIYMYI